MKHEETIIPCPECGGEGTKTRDGKKVICDWCEGACQVTEDYDGPPGSKIEHFEFAVRETGD